MIQVRVLFPLQGQVVFAFVRVAIVDDDHFELRVILLQHSGQIAAQVFHFLTGIDDDR